MTKDDPLSYQIIGACIAVSKGLGVGLLESVYVRCLQYELQKRGLSAAHQVLLPFIYDGRPFDAAFKIDLIVEQAVIVEVKAVTAILPVHEAQLLTYMRLSGIHKGLLINFYAYPFTKGIKRMVL